MVFSLIVSQKYLVLIAGVWSQSQSLEREEILGSGAGAGATYFKQLELELHIFKRLKLKAIF